MKEIKRKENYQACLQLLSEETGEKKTKIALAVLEKFPEIAVNLANIEKDLREYKLKQ